MRVKPIMCHMSLSRCGYWGNNRLAGHRLSHVPRAYRACGIWYGSIARQNEVGSDMPFESPDLGLGDLLAMAGAGKVQLPDFQRPWKWDDDRILSLLATV